MYRDKKLLFRQIMLMLFIIMLYINGCKGSKNQVVEDQEPIIEVEDRNLIFDGKTLEGWEITNFGPQGPVYVSAGNIILGMGDGCTGITWIKDFPSINYEVSLEAKRVSGTDFFCGITFPVGDDPCTLIVGGWGGTVVGLSSIDNRDASENETTSLMKFEKDRWYNICLRVKEDTIKAFIDDVEVINFALGGKKLSIRPEVNLSRPFGIASWCTTSALRNIRLDSI